MSFKTISLSESAYEALAAMRRPGESFSDIVLRLTRRRSLTELAHVMDRKAAQELRRAVEQNRAARMAARKRELGL